MKDTKKASRANKLSMRSPLNFGVVQIMLIVFQYPITQKIYLKP